MCKKSIQPQSGIIDNKTCPTLNPRVRYGNLVLMYKPCDGYHPQSSYPEPGIYLKSYGYGFGLVLVSYSSNKNMVAEKLTGIKSFV